MKLSVISTLAVTLQLAAQYFSLLLPLSILAAIPNEIVDFASAPADAQHPFANVLAGGVGFVAALLVTSVKSAAILGAVKRETGTRFWPAIKSTVHSSTWTLVRVQILLMAITFVIALPVGFFSAFLVSAHIFIGQYLVIFMAILSLVLLKYALADPIVVVEKTGARAALARSWEMTRGRYGYVLGCFLFLAAANYFLAMFLTVDLPIQPFTFLSVVSETSLDLLSSVWVLMAWVMYVKLKEADSSRQLISPVDAPPQPNIA